jgi:membrane-bound serine protease (ClpP class)
VTARAASAGTFITLAANVAVMAPGTRIGSAHPVFSSPFGSGGENNENSIMMKKVVNDSASFIISIAKQRGRNVKWAEQAVRNSANVTADEAVKLKVVDFIAPNIRALLEKADGMKVKTAAGQVTLNTKDSPVQNFPMPWYKEFLNILANGTVAFILLLIAIFGIIFEINTPGATLPGVIGGIALILFLYSASVLPINWAGILLIILAIVLFIVDIKVPTHGVLTIGGVIAFFLGAMIVFGTGNPAMAAPIAVIAAGTLATALFFAFLVGLGVRALKRPVVTGREAVIGQITTARTNIDPVGKIFMEGSWWTAEAEDQPIMKGDKVRIVGIEGLKLRVIKDDGTREEA